MGKFLENHSTRFKELVLYVAGKPLILKPNMVS